MKQEVRQAIATADTLYFQIHDLIMEYRETDQQTTDTLREARSHIHKMEKLLESLIEGKE